MSLPLITLGFIGQGGTTAFPTVRDTSVFKDTTFEFSHDVTIPSGTTTGDLVVVFGLFTGSGFGTGVTVETPAGWERFGFYEIGDFSDFCAFWRIADGPMSTVTIARQGSTDAFTAHCNAYTFSAHSANFGFDPVISSIELFTTASPNPPELAIPDEWGGAAHVTWLSCTYKGGTNTTSAHSADYTDRITTGDNASRMMSARRNLIAVAEDPGAWTTSASAGAIPFTIAVRGPE